MARDDKELLELQTAWRMSQPSGTRRQVLKWSAVAAGAVATTRFGVASAAPAEPAGWSAYTFQSNEILTDQTINVPLDPYGQIVTLDPHRTVNWGPFWAIFPNVWGGLVRYDENAKVQLDLAESFTVSEDGREFQFKIRSDAKYANGNPVLADHFISSWKRALDPENPSPMVQFMHPLRNFTKYMQGTSKSIGFEAIDDATVGIKLSKAYTYFLSYLASYVWSVVDPAVLKDKGDEDFALADAGTGPWRFTEFDASTQLVMEPNENHYGGVSESISKIVWPFVTGPTAASSALNMYKADEAVSADVPISLKAQSSVTPISPISCFQLIRRARFGSWPWTGSRRPSTMFGSARRLPWPLIGTSFRRSLRGHGLLRGHSLHRPSQPIVATNHRKGRTAMSMPPRAC